MNSKTIIGVLAAMLSAAAIAGCGATAPMAAPSVTVTAPAPATSAAEHNAADITFVQGMIPHHTQAVAMSDLVAGRGASPQVIDLAMQIANAQGPEITHMQGFLRSWDVPAAPTGGMVDHDMGGSGTAGMMSDQQMQQLGASNGAAFDRMYLQMMIEHHTGAITMAQTEVRDGQNPEAKALAQKIVDAQQAEIITMTQLLTTS